MSPSTPSHMKQEFLKRLEVMSALANMIIMDVHSGETYSYNISQQVTDLERQLVKLKAITDHKDFRGY